MTALIDLTGQTFGQLVVTGRAGRTSAGNVTWSCQCACGATTRSSGTDLRRGRTTTCGCGAVTATRARWADTRDLIGQHFGRLTVVEFAGLNDYPRATWRCACTCGNTVTVTGHHLQDGTTVSCGCRAADPRPGALQPHVTYGSAHSRVKRLKGAASLHDCIDCGTPAADWSYDHSDPEAVTDDRGRSYSMDPLRYQPRCYTCHRQFDQTSRAHRTG